MKLVTVFTDLICPFSLKMQLGTNMDLTLFLFQGMIALRRGATELNHEDYMEGILEVQAKKKANLQYYA